MFPGLRQRFDAALDLIVEFSTLGEYRLAAPSATDPASALTAAPTAVAEAAGLAGCAPMESRVPRLGGDGGNAARAAGSTVAGGAVASARGPGLRVPSRGAAATPAARRLALAAACHGATHPHRGGRLVTRTSRTRAGTPMVPEQLCLAV
jgi:hypothetical protein